MRYHLTILLYLLSAFISVISKTFPKIIWTYWNMDYSDDRLLKMLEQNRRLKGKGWEVRMLNPNNIEQYLNPIRYYKGDFFTSTSPWPGDAPHRSDFLRLLILSYYGGVYFDFAIILLQDLSWLEFEALRQNPDVENKHGDEPDVLLFTFPHYGSYNTTFIKQLNQTFEISPGYEIWFMAAKPNTTFMQQFFKQYRAGLLQDMISNSEVLDKVARQQRMELGALYGSTYLSSLKVIQIIVQRKQQQLDKMAVEKQQSRTLASWYYKIWHIKSQKGPFAVMLATGDQAHFFSRCSEQQLNKIFNVKLKYFVKFIGGDRAYLQVYTTDLSQINLFNFIYIIWITRSFIFQKFLYPQKFIIYEPSVLYQYLIKPSSLKDTFQNVVDGHYQQSNIDLQFKKRVAIFCGVLKSLGIIAALFLFCLAFIMRKLRKKHFSRISKIQTQDDHESFQTTQRNDDSQIVSL